MPLYGGFACVLGVFLRPLSHLTSLVLRRKSVDRKDKQTFIANFKESVSDASILLLAHYRGLNVAKMEELRRTAKQEEVSVKVTKNRLVRLALEGTPFDTLSSLLHGPVVALYGKDPIASAKVAWNFSKKEEQLEILGAFVDGKLIELQEIQKLANLPSIDELRGKLVGLLQAPAQKVAAVAGAPAAQLARLFDAYAQKS